MTNLKRPVVGEPSDNDGKSRRPCVGDKIFVYGTLRPGERAWDMLKERTRLITHRAILDKAKMFNINNNFPGVVLGGTEADIVVGDLFEITDEHLPARLDGYEGYPDLYDRQEVMLVDGRTAWIYTFNYPTDKHQQIMSGDWKRRKEELNKAVA